jgi:hypothetical protein
MNFDTLNFGAPAAERDLARGLVDYFVRSDAYTRVASRQGNRGTGKSALFKFLAEQSKRPMKVLY